MPLRAQCFIAPALLLSARSVLAFEYDLDVAYTGDVLSNVGGGIQTGTRYLDNLDVTLEADLEELWGIGGGTVFLYGLYNNGTTFSEELVGDLQVISNIDAIEAWRLYEAWYEWRGSKWSIRSGLYDLNSEFDVKESGALFLNSSHGIGAEFSQSGRNGPGIFPVSSLAVRVEYQTRNLVARLAVLDGVPGDPDDPTSNAIDIGGNDGTLSVAELEAPLTDAARLWGGYWRYSADFDRLTDGGAADGNDGWYIGAEADFTLGAKNGAGFLRYGRANASFNPVETFIGLGAVITSPMASRPDDQLGLSIAVAGLGAPYKAILNEAGGVAPSHEIIWELTYRSQINRFLALQPDIQYVQNPAGAALLDDVWVVGLRVQLDF